MDFVKSEIAVFRKASGRLVQLAPAHLPPTEPAFDWIALPEGYDPTTHTWDAEGRQMVEDMAKLRALRWAEIKLARDAAEVAGCETPLGRIDTTAASQVKIAGAVQMAMLAQAAGEPFSISWTMQDNTTVDHDDAAMIGMGLAVGQHVRVCHEVSRTKREQLEAATDAATIAVVDPASGWPA